ncbi:MAG: cell division protein FtsA [Candidatus Nealsonbacteria bacterium]
MAKNRIITGLDIGTCSIKALSAILKKPDFQEFEVLGNAEIISSGIRKGVVVNIEKASKDIGQVLSQLQADIGQKIDDVYVNIGGSHVFSTPSHGTVIVSRADQKISEEDVNRVIQASQAFSLPSNKEILDVFPREFIVDGQGEIKEPLGMQGLRLEAGVVLLCAFSPYLKNLTSAVLNAGYQVSDIVPSPLASSKAVLTPQQKELGVCLVDIGSGTVDLAVYEEGDLIHTAIFPVGSAHITNDLAIGLKTDIDVAEKIKKEFGRCVLKGGNKKEKIELPKDSGENESLIFSHKMLVDIIEARVFEIFDLIQKELKKISPKGSLPAGIVLTGGGAKLPKIVELAKKELKLPVRIGIPQGFTGLEGDSALSTVCGLVIGGMDFEEKSKILAGFSPGMKGNIGKRIRKIFKIFIP